MPPVAVEPYVSIGELLTTIWPSAGKPEPATETMRLVASAGHGPTVVSVTPLVSVPVAGVTSIEPRTSALAPVVPSASAPAVRSDASATDSGRMCG